MTNIKIILNLNGILKEPQYYIIFSHVINEHHLRNSSSTVQ